jgi:hypothetical protein
MVVQSFAKLRKYPFGGAFKIILKKAGWMFGDIFTLVPNFVNFNSADIFIGEILDGF